MMRDNILRVAFKGKTEITTLPLYQYDYGQKLKFIDIDLPFTYEVHFSNFVNGTSITNIGGPDGVAIPDTVLQSGLTIYVWVYLHSGLDDGETEYKVIIPVNKRAQPSNDQPSQEQQDIITQTLATLASIESAMEEKEELYSSILEQITVMRNLVRQYAGWTEQWKDETVNAVNQIKDSAQLGYITIGSTRLTEEKLIKLLELIEE